MALDLQMYLAAIENELMVALAPQDPTMRPLYQMMQYHMGWLDEHFEPVSTYRGKRLRPLICLLTCAASGGDWQRALPAAASIELVHNFTLIHDDIEDNGDTRRHRPTLWRVWGLAQGVNTGDAMWAIARTHIYRLLDNGYEPKQVLNIARRLDEASVALCRGQDLDLAFEQREHVSLAEYERMIAGKTAALLSASAAIGATLGKVSEAITLHYANFGHELGLAFQMVDDILGIWGDPQVTGKPNASDIREHKKTLPILHALERERAQGDDALAKRLARRELDDADVNEALILLERLGAREYAQRRAQKHYHRALQHLAATARSGPAQDALSELANSLVERTF